MGFRLRMSGEIHDWLTDLRDSDWPAAMMAGQALTALATEGDALGPPLLISQRGQVRPANMPDALDQAYQDRLKEVLKATYAAAQAEHVIEQAWVQSGGDGGTEDDEAGPPVTGTAARLDDILDRIERELGDQAAAEGLMELRPGAPGDSEIRILFAAEPPGTALLIAVIEGQETVRDHFREAVVLASATLRQARAGQAPEAAAHTFGSAQSSELRRGDPGLQAGEETPPPPLGVSRGIPTQITANVFDMAKTVKRAYKYRFYPTPEQAADLSRTFGCVREVYNLALEARTAAWDQRQETRDLPPVLRAAHRVETVR